jgi:hypothetical protein
MLIDSKNTDTLQALNIDIGGFHEYRKSYIKTHVDNFWNKCQLVVLHTVKSYWQ